MRRSENERVGLRELINPDKSGLEKLPQLQSLFGKVLRDLQSRLSLPIFAQLKTIRYERFGTVVEKADPKSVAGIFSLPEWGARGLLLYDTFFANSVVELGLGGSIGEPAADILYSRAVRSLLERDMELTLTSFASQLHRIRQCKLEKSELGLSGASFFSPKDWVLLAEISLQEESGKMQFIILRELIERLLEGEGQKVHDLEWQEHVYQEMAEAEVEVSVVLQKEEVEAEKVWGWKKGDLVPLRSRQAALVTVGSMPLFRGKVGKEEPWIGVTIGEKLF